MQTWRPTCSRETWIQRQRLSYQVRDFFLGRGALEVETPVLSSFGGTDPHLDYFESERFVDVPGALRSPLYMPTSPEFHMKRLLASGFGDCFQIARAFRNGECGERHNSEFSMVEWYRVGWELDALMDEVEALVSCVLDRPIKALRTPWKRAFELYAGVDPLRAEYAQWQDCCVRHGLPCPEGASGWTREDWWDYVMVSVVEPALGAHGAEFLTHYPASQAALARLQKDEEGREWAQRFELYVDGMELCNGYNELQDASEQHSRFQADLEARTRLGKRIPALDMHFLEALRHGLPACSGVALGLDRLYMLALGKKNIQEVLLFPDANA